jgi:carbamoyltransferase
VLKAFKALTGVPILLNTSFNDQEPIVCSPQDALNTALRCGVDYLVLGDSIVRVDPTLLIPELPLEVYFEKLR